MKRCHRFIQHETPLTQEPYFRFDFEKSLRKYEKMPAKKQKRDVSQSRHGRHKHQDYTIAVQGKAEEKAAQGGSKCVLLPVSPETTEEVRQSQQSQHSQTVKQFDALPQSSQQNATNATSTPSLVNQATQPQHLPQQHSPSALSLCQQRQQSQLRSSGRFHLGSSVFISTRSLQRLVRLGSEELVLQELFKQRHYLAEDSGEVARRVRQYMEQ